MKLWHELKGMSIPIVEVGAIVSLGIVGALWADDLGDKQETTQDQLGQLVDIVAKTTKENAEVHKTQSDSLTSIEQSLELLAQEVRLRRELEAENAANTH